MRNMHRLVLIGVVLLGSVAHATVPSIDELRRLDGEELRSVLVGNTYTFSADFGRWVDYVISSDASIGRAWGDWGSQSVTGKVRIKDDGEWCKTYSGDYHWSQPGNEYCAVVYTDNEGNYYSKRTKDTHKPERVGRVYKVEIRSGNVFDLCR